MNKYELNADLKQFTTPGALKALEDILAALNPEKGGQPLTISALSKAVNRHSSGLYRYIAALRKAKKIYVIDFEATNCYNKRVAIFALCVTGLEVDKDISRAAAEWRGNDIDAVMRVEAKRKAQDIKPFADPLTAWIPRRAAQ